MRFGFAVACALAALLGVSRVSQAQEHTVPLAARLQESAIIDPAVPIPAGVMAFSIADASRVLFDVVSDTALRVRVVGPTGREFCKRINYLPGEDRTGAPADSPSCVASQRIEVSDAKTSLGPLAAPTAGIHAILAVDKPADGTWWIWTTAPPPTDPNADARVPVLASATMDSGSRIGMTTSAPIVRVGKPVVFTVSAFRSGVPIRGATIEAAMALERPDGTVVDLGALQFRDNGTPTDGDADAGDGLYSAVAWPPKSESGELSVSARLRSTLPTGYEVVRDTGATVSLRTELPQ